ncbi:MAG: response regulator [Verrucomicrobia bacterium]|nr:response regulator [Verrucomicrobiota bacterium]
MLMPGMDGFQLCRLMKDDPNLKSIPTIMLTGYESNDLRGMALQAGADDFLNKTTDMPKLVNYIQIQLEKGPSGDAQRAARRAAMSV